MRATSSSPQHLRESFSVQARHHRKTGAIDDLHFSAMDRADISPSVLHSDRTAIEPLPV
jgi:hypothetical protein